MSAPPPPPPPPPPSGATPLLDHVVILVPHSFLASPPRWFADGELFHFYPGGRHADGRTENTLVLLRDGSYLEFIAFRPGGARGPGPRAGHRWGRAAEGAVVDWAVTLLSPSSPPSSSGDADDDAGEGGEDDGPRQAEAFRGFRARVRAARAGIAYGDLARGGRARPDGAHLRWAVAVAAAERDAAVTPATTPAPGASTDATSTTTTGVPAVAPGTVPFWCLDITDRDLRVPYRTPALGAENRRRHPSGAVGVASVRVHAASAAEAEGAAAVYDVLLGERRKKKSDKGGADYVYWGIGTPAGSSAGGGGGGGGEDLHPGGEVRLLGASEEEGGGAAPPGIDIELYTDDEALDGKVVGGKVDEQRSLWIRLVWRGSRRR